MKVNQKQFDNPIVWTKWFKGINAKNLEITWCALNYNDYA